MFNSLNSLKKIILFVYLCIFIIIFVLLWQMILKADIPIKEVLIKGHYQSIDHDQIQLIANKYLVGNFFTVNLKHTQNAFKKLPWVRDASIRRKWPDKLLITIEEHKVIARWGNIGLVNRNGEIFNAAFQDDLPIFMGNEKDVQVITKKYFEINEILEKELMHIGTIKLNDRLSWEIVTLDQIRIILGKNNITEKIRLFIQNYQAILLNLKKRIDYVDLRYKDGFSVKVIDERKSKSGKERSVL